MRFIHIQCVRPDVYEHRLCAAQHIGVDSGNERERGDDHLVTRGDVKKNRRHLERVRAGSSQQHFGHTKRFFEELVTFLSESPIPRNLPGCNGLGYIDKLVS